MAEEKKIEKCENCIYFRWADSVWGYCKRFPKKEIMISWFPKIKYDMQYPETLYEDFCGEFKEKPAQKR